MLGKVIDKAKGVAKSLGTEIASHAGNAKDFVVDSAGSAKDFVVERAQIAALKVSGKINGVPEDPFYEMSLESGNFVLEIIEAYDVPKCDVFSPSDPFIDG